MLIIIAEEKYLQVKKVLQNKILWLRVYNRTIILLVQTLKTNKSYFLLTFREMTQLGFLFTTKQLA
jgi:hypothetical protein